MTAKKGQTQPQKRDGKLIRVAPETHQRLKVRAATEGKKMGQLLDELSLKP